MPLQPGDHVELMARTPDGSTRAPASSWPRCTSTEGSWLARIDCDAENPSSPAIARLVEDLLAAA